MVIVNASIEESDGNHFITIKNNDDETKIPISEDNPIAVKNAFNKLIEWIRNGDFEVQMEDVGGDLFSQVASEYITQLNGEIQEVRKEMEENGLVSSDEV